MQFEKGYLYHIYNQGNNKQTIFYNPDNYLFFLRKIHPYILPYADVLSWCLMPNHFHWMVYVKETELALPLDKISVGVAPNIESVGVASSDTDATKLLSATKTRTFNQSIGILLRSYTNAINKQQKRSGKLFREGTKAECINCFKGISPSFIGNTSTIKPSEEQYPEICFHYLHQNPVKAGLVKKATDWHYSSAKEYANLRNGSKY